MRKQIGIVALLFILSIIVSCSYEGDLQQEVGVVVGKSYQPYSSSSGVGFSTSGNTVITSSSTPEMYCVVFRCFDHNKTFSIESKELYTELSEKDTVEISYKGVYSQHDSSLKDFDFISAVKRR